MKKPVIKLSSGHMIPTRVLDEDAETMTLQVAKDDQYKFDLSEDKEKNQFYVIAFIKVTDGQPAAWKPWEGE